MKESGQCKFDTKCAFKHVGVAKAMDATSPRRPKSPARADTPNRRQRSKDAAKAKARAGGRSTSSERRRKKNGQRPRHANALVYLGAACAAASIQQTDASILVRTKVIPVLPGTEVVRQGRKASLTTDVGEQTEKVVATIIDETQVPSPDLMLSG